MSLYHGLCPYIQKVSLDPGLFPHIRGYRDFFRIEGHRHEHTHTHTHTYTHTPSSLSHYPWSGLYILVCRDTLKKAWAFA